MIALAIVLALGIIAYFTAPALFDCLAERDDIQKSDTEKERLKLFNEESELTDCFLEPEKFL